MEPNPNQTSPPVDALLPLAMAKRSETIGERKATMPLVPTLVLGILAGAFIALGCIFYTVVMSSGHSQLPFGVSKLLGGLAFSLGLVLVIVGGAELFTGNNLIVMAWASRRVSSLQVLRNWFIVYVGNLIGAFGIAALVYVAGIADQNQGEVGNQMIAIAVAKSSHTWVQAIAAGILCNILVCLAVWLCLSARSVADKVLSIIFPITAFVTVGAEHCVANMFFFPIAIMVQSDRPMDANTSTVQWSDFLLANLIPVTLGNVIGGAVLVGLVYWFVYLHHAKDAD